MFNLIQSIWFISMIFLNSITNQLINKIHVTMIHEKLIFSNQSMNYSNRYYYLELIKMNQFTPIIFDNAMATTIHEQETLIIKPQFQIFYYGLPFTSVEILNNGIIHLSTESNLSEKDRIIRSYKESIVDDGCNWMNMHQMEMIKAFNGIPVGSTIKTINNDEYLAIQWSYSGEHSNNEKNIEDHVQVVCVLYPNGNISIYYKKIPNALENKVDGLMLRAGKFTEINNEVYYETNGEYFTVIKIPSTVVKSGTLIEYSPLTFCDGIDYVENIPGNMIHYKNTSVNIMSDVVCQDIQNTKCPIIGCNVKSIEVSNNESTYSTEVITEQTINNPLLPNTFSLISYEQQLLQSGRNVDVDLVMRRFTISLLLPFLLIATVLCIAFPLFLYRTRAHRMIS
ncbi:unnamed protein product [Schistosoma guineensis]|nr:unnamed protein product [Schistosoma guineensis]